METMVKVKEQWAHAMARIQHISPYFADRKRKVARESRH
jgi:hypothetical protein